MNYRIAMHISISALLLSFISCNTATNLKTYYFQIDQESETQVFKYVNPKDSTFSEYWEIISDPYDNSIITHSYNADFTKYNTFYEEYTDDGAKLIDYVDYEKMEDGSWKKIKSEMITDDVFLWDRKNSYDYSVKYVNKYGRFNFRKLRTDVGFVDVEIENEKYKTIKFVDRYFVEAIDQNDKYTFQQISYYAENVGMVKYERYIPNSGLRVLELRDILTEQEFQLEKKRFENKNKVRKYKF